MISLCEAIVNSSIEFRNIDTYTIAKSLYNTTKFEFFLESLALILYSRSY